MNGIIVLRIQSQRFNRQRIIQNGIEPPTTTLLAVMER